MKQRALFLINFYLPPILWAVFIYFLSAQSSLPSFSGALFDFIFKKLSHMFVYGALYFLLFRAVNTDAKSKHKNWFLPLLICFCYASLDEVHQSFTPNRSPTLRDVGYDLLGASIAFLKIYRYI